MPDYQKGKIYKLWSPMGNEIYIGSTCDELYKRKNKHKTSMDCSSKILFEKYNDVRIELIEYFPCNNKQELNKKEGEYIRNNICVNRYIAGRTHKEYDKEYYENNQEKIKEKKKEYYEDNKESIKEHYKEYYEKNKESIKEYKKEYNQKKITCECGRTFRIDGKLRHERSKFHQDAIGGALGDDLTS